MAQPSRGQAQQQSQQDRAKYNTPHKPPPEAPKAEMRDAPPVASSQGFAEDLQAAVDAGQVYKMTGDITLDRPVTVDIRKSHAGWFGLTGNYFKVYSRVQGAPAITFRMADGSTPNGTCARAFLLENLTVLGSGQEDGGIKIDVPAQGSWLVNPSISNLWIEGCGGKGAFVMRGNIFEGTLYSVGTQDNLGSGIYLANAGGAAVLSAIRIYGATQRQNNDWGILCDQYDGPSDVRIHGMYFCLNKKGGINYWSGLELIEDCGFENNGEYGLNVQNFCHMNRVTGSTNGTQPILVIGYLANPWTLTDCAMTGYMGGNPTFGSFTGNGQTLTFRGSYDKSKITIGGGVNAVYSP
jgi:hypothetical protein